MVSLVLWSVSCKRDRSCKLLKKYMHIKLLEVKLKLTPEQIKQAKSFKEVAQAKIKVSKERMNNIKEEIHTLLTSYTKPNPFLLQQKVRQKQALKTEMYLAKMQYKLQIRDILNTEQLDKWFAWLNKNHKRHNRKCDHKKCQHK